MNSNKKLTKNQLLEEIEEMARDGTYNKGFWEMNPLYGNKYQNKKKTELLELKERLNKYYDPRIKFYNARIQLNQRENVISQLIQSELKKANKTYHCFDKYSKVDIMGLLNDIMKIFNDITVDDYWAINQASYGLAWSFETSRLSTPIHNQLRYMYVNQICDMVAAISCNIKVIGDVPDYINDNENRFLIKKDF